MQRNRIKYRHLQCFVAIVRHGSLKAASGVLNLTQPALSKTLKELEGHLGATLLTRDRGGVRLTPEGRAFLSYAEQSLAALERGIAGIGALTEGASVTLSVGSLPSVAARLMPRAVTIYRRIAPATRLTVTDGTHEGMVARLRRGEVDLVVGRLGPPDTMQGLTFTQLYLERAVCVCRPGHPLLDSAAPLDMDLLDAYPMILPPEGAAIRTMVENWLISEGRGAPEDAILSVSGAFGRNFVRQSDALWLISEGVVAPDLAEGRLAALPFDTGLTAGPVGLMTRPETTPHAASALFADALGRAVRELGLVG